jgi:hypothetical protein
MCFRFIWLNKRTKKVPKTEHLNFLGKMCLLQSYLIEQNCFHVWRSESGTNVERSSFNSVGFASSDQSRKRVLPSIWVSSKFSSTLSKFEISSNLHQDLSMKEGPVFCFVLFCRYEIHWTGMLQTVFLVSLESSRWGGVHAPGSMTFGLVVQKFFSIEYFFTEN